VGQDPGKATPMLDLFTYQAVSRRLQTGRAFPSRFANFGLDAFDPRGKASPRRLEDESLMRRCVLSIESECLL
jgi:hypothetical protein